jgi:hypothetical protein
MVIDKDGRVAQLQWHDYIIPIFLSKVHNLLLLISATYK